MKVRSKTIHWLLVGSFWGITCLRCPGQTSSPSVQVSQKPKTLEQRVIGGDPYAFLEAADANRKDLVPAIEKFSGSSTVQKALAKLGVKKYLDEILLELTDPTNSVAGRALISPPGFPPEHVALVVRVRAFEKLAYIKDRSTVKVLVSFLYAKENPMDYVEVGGFDAVSYDLPSEIAMQTLAQIVGNPPKIDLSATSETHDARIKIWQQWWEKNKDKYP